jgi:protein SCO1
MKYCCKLHLFTVLLQLRLYYAITLQKYAGMKRRWLIYVVFFAVLLITFYIALFSINDFSKANLAVINPNVQDFAFTDQNGKPFTNRQVDGKVYVAEYFFTTCKGICPIMNASMRRVYDAYKSDSGFCIVSHTCMPETDSIPMLKAYEQYMLGGNLQQNKDGSYRVDSVIRNRLQESGNWFFVTGDKAALYRMARQSYIIDNNQRDTAQKISDQFIHTQFFALVDKQRQVRGIYDGLKQPEVDKLIQDIKALLKEKRPNSRFMNGFSNTPN